MNLAGEVALGIGREQPGIVAGRAELEAGRQVGRAVEVGFVETEYFWPITHMVAPAENSLGCESCHSHDGRLQNIEGIYIPGQSRYPWLDMIGWLAVIGSLAGVSLHGLARIVAAKRRNRRNL